MRNYLIIHLITSLPLILLILFTFCNFVYASEHLNTKKNVKIGVYLSSLYELEIEYKLVNEKFILDNQPSLWIKNPKLPNGMFYIYGGKYDIIKLRDLILSKFLSDFTPSLGDLEDTLDEIVKGVL